VPACGVLRDVLARGVLRHMDKVQEAWTRCKMDKVQEAWTRCKKQKEAAPSIDGTLFQVEAIAFSQGKFDFRGDDVRAHLRDASRQQEVCVCVHVRVCSRVCMCVSVHVCTCVCAHVCDGLALP